MSKPEKRTKAEQREATTALLLEIAREIFTRDGYAGAATEEIVERAGLTRGALYHHFVNKEGLFHAVVESLQARTAAHIETITAQYSDPWDQLIAGSVAFLEISLDPQIQRIMLVDAPAVLGWSVWRDMDARHSMKSLREALATLIDQGVLPEMPLEAITHLLSGAMNEAALWIAQSDTPQARLGEAADALKHLLQGLRMRGVAE